MWSVYNVSSLMLKMEGPTFALKVFYIYFLLLSRDCINLFKYLKRKHTIKKPKSVWNWMLRLQTNTKCSSHTRSLKLTKNIMSVRGCKLEDDWVEMLTIFHHLQMIWTLNPQNCCCAVGITSNKAQSQLLAKLVI